MITDMSNNPKTPSIGANYQLGCGTRFGASLKEQLFSKVVEAGGRLTVKSALNPILWLCGIITIPTLAAGTFYPHLATWIVAVGCAPVIVALFGFLFLLFFDRDKLQSEDYQIKKRTIELAQQKGDAYPLLVDSEAAVENPDSKSFHRQMQRPRNEQGLLISFQYRSWFA